MADSNDIHPRGSGGTEGAEATGAIKAIEAMLWDYEPDSDPAGLVLVDRRDCLMWSSASDSPYANRVVRVNFPAARVPAEVNEVRAFFNQRGHRFTWWIGPSSRPKELPGHLLSDASFYWITMKGWPCPCLWSRKAPP